MVKIYVLDTNILIQAPYAIDHFEDNSVVLPMVVLEELDHLKKAEGEIGANARRSIRRAALRPWNRAPHPMRQGPFCRYSTTHGRFSQQAREKTPPIWRPGRHLPIVFSPQICYTEKNTQRRGGTVMSRADALFLQNCRDILDHGVWDTDLPVRPHWEDGTPAHTVKKFGIVNRYDLQEEFPILTLRRTYWKTAVDELLWIWQKKSNNIHDLNGHIWDEWADPDGSIGKAYGYQLSIKHQYPEGEMDQVDRVLYDLKHNPASRRILTSLYNHQDLHEMNLYPCAWSMTFNVSGNVLNAILNQRSQDMLAANNWNVVQYAVLVHMLAQVSGLVPGELVHVIADAHIYDRHVPIIEKMLAQTPSPAPVFRMDPSVTDFYAFTRDSFSLEGYTPAPFEDQIPIAI